jgi:hypothetical protein
VAWTVTSDKRWKTDIVDSQYGLDFINSLRPVSYLRKADDMTGAHREYGFIAQDVEQTLASIGDKTQGFLTKTDAGYLELRYNDFIAILTKGVQELAKMSTEHSVKLQQLEQENKDLRENLRLQQERIDAISEKLDALTQGK